MRENLESKVYNSKVFQWLKSDNMIFKGQDDSDYTFIKYPYSKKLDIIYGNHLYNTGINGRLSYSGIYDKEKEELIVVDYYLSDALGLNWGDHLYMNNDEVEEKLKNKINICIENYVSQHQHEFYEAAKDIEGICNFREVEHDFVNGCENYEYKSDILNLPENHILEFLDNENNIFDYVSNYILQNKDYIGYQLKSNDKQNEYLTSIINNKEHGLYKAKKIRDILNNSNAQRVQVYIRKDGINFDFKYDKEYLKYNIADFLSLYGMPAYDRKRFKFFFDNKREFNYENIYKIEYRNKPIYIDQNYEKSLEKEEYSL